METSTVSIDTETVLAIIDPRSHIGEQLQSSLAHPTREFIMTAENSAPAPVAAPTTGEALAKRMLRAQWDTLSATERNVFGM